DGLIEGVLRGRLATHGYAIYAPRPDVGRQSDPIARDQFAGIVRPLLGHELHGGRVETRMQDREDEPALALEQYGEPCQEWLDGGHVHHRHGANGRVEPAATERGER